MKQIRILNVVFDTEIAPYETPAFRGAVIQKVGLEHEFFHNHDNQALSGSAFHYRYPLIQYKRQRRKPAILFIEKGIDEAKHFFSNPDWTLHFASRQYQAAIASMDVKQYPIGVTDKEYQYTLRRWMGLNQKNYHQFKKLDDQEAQVQLLEKILPGHILGFAKGVGHWFERRFDLTINELLGVRTSSFEGVKIMTFDLRFSTNLLLPPIIGLGKGVSQGYGVVQFYREAETSNQN